MSRKNDRTARRPITPGKPKEWTVMIYLAGDNNLSEECVWAIKELYRVGLCEDIAVIAQYDSVAPGMPVTRYDLTDLPPSTPSESAQTISRDTSGEQQAYAAFRNMDEDAKLPLEAHDDKHVREFVTATAMINFAKDCVTKHPAKHYMLVLSGHGSAATTSTS